MLKQIIIAFLFGAAFSMFLINHALRLVTDLYECGDDAEIGFFTVECKAMEAPQPAKEGSNQ